MVGATVVMVDGTMTVYLARGYREIAVVLPQDEPFRSRIARAAARALMAHARGEGTRTRPMFIATIANEPALDHPFAAFLEEAGFAPAGAGLHVPRRVLEAHSDSAPDLPPSHRAPDLARSDGAPDLQVRGTADEADDA